MPDSTTTTNARSKAILALLLLVPAPSIGITLAMIIAPGTTVGKVGFFLCKAWLLLFPLIWRLVIEKKPISLSPAKKGGFGVGLWLGLLISAVIVGAYVLFGSSLIDADHVRQEASKNGIGTPALYIGAALYWICINSVLEEYVYRWFMVEQCEKFVSRNAAIILSAVFFTLHHVIALKMQFDWVITAIASLGVFIGGALWSWMYIKYRSVWPVWLSHAIVDIAIFAIGWYLIFGGGSADPAAVLPAAGG